MRTVALFAILFAPLVVLAQNNNNDTNNGGNSQSVQVSTSFSQGISFDGNRQPHTVSQPVAVTITQAASPAPSSNSTGNSTNSGNSTTDGNSTSSQPTSTGPLPTAPSDVDGGGNGPHGAPMPGQEGSNGEFGPGDGYTTSGVMAVERNAILVSIAGMAVGGALALW